jgi:hypothetical protein
MLMFNFENQYAVMLVVAERLQAGAEICNLLAS